MLPAHDQKAPVCFQNPLYKRYNTIAKRFFMHFFEYFDATPAPDHLGITYGANLWNLCTDCAPRSHVPIADLTTHAVPG